MPFQYLGLREDADEREVRRSYARLLKTTRPDDDAAGFQRLNEAYQACLQHIRYREWEARQQPGEAAEAANGETLAPAMDKQQAADVATARTTDPASPEPAAEKDAEGGESSEPRYFDLNAFLAALFEQVDKGSPGALSTWLYAQPDLYSIGLKSAITVEVLQVVSERQPPVPVALLEAITGFFGIDSLGPRDWWLIDRVNASRARAATLERFRTGNLPRVSKEPVPYFDRLIDRDLARPKWHWTTPLLCLLPTMPTRGRNRIHELNQLTEGFAEQAIDPERAALYRELADRTQLSGRRLLLSLTRSVLFGTPLFLWMTHANGEFSPELLIAFGSMAMVFLAWQAVTAGLHRVRAYLEARGHGHRIREGGIGLLLLLGLGIGAARPDAPGLLPYSLVLIAAWHTFTLPRMTVGFAICALFAFADLMVSLPGGGLAWPLPPSLAGLALASASVLGLDRLRSKLTGVPVTTMLHDVLWMKRFLFGSFIALVVLGVAAAMALSP
jgi:hypothetical protein